MYDEEQAAVQAIVAKEETIVQIVQNIPMVIFALFLGPWSDTAGRKLLLCIPLIGYFISASCMILNVYFFDQLVVEFLWLDGIRNLFGGWVLFFLGSYGYVADTTSDKSRTMRISIFDGTYAISNAVGSFVNGYIFSSLGYYGSFGISGLCNLLGAIIAFIAIHEKPRVKKEKKKLFDLQNVFGSFKVLFKPRPNNLRPVLIFLFLGFQMFMVGIGGVHNIDYFYLRKKFEWEGDREIVTFMSQLSSFNSAANIVSSFLVLPLFVKLLKLEDPSIAIIGVSCHAVRIIVYLLATSKPLLYISIATSSFSYLVTQPIRSSLSKIVGPDDVGKVTL